MSFRNACKQVLSGRLRSGPPRPPQIAIKRRPERQKDGLLPCLIVGIALLISLLAPAAGQARPHYSPYPLRSGLAKAAMRRTADWRFDRSYGVSGNHQVSCRRMARDHIQRCRIRWRVIYVLGHKARDVVFQGRGRVASYVRLEDGLQIVGVRFRIHRRCVDEMGGCRKVARGLVFWRVKAGVP